MELFRYRPLYNEEQNVEPLYEAIVNVMIPWRSTTKSFWWTRGAGTDIFKSKGTGAERPRLWVIKFRRNYGQTPAMAAGIDHAEEGS
jgi:hypothetical protein